ncbi:MAG: hypothetical protein CMH49_08085 [Myxococcales bacterium]|nr:hypothetical protein [Myxococcales bacterium]
MITPRNGTVLKSKSSLLNALVMMNLMVLNACSDPVSDAVASGEDTRVGINTLREPFHKSDHVCSDYPSYYLEFLDDTKCQKILPSQRDREFQCPIQSSKALIDSVSGYATVDAVVDGQLDIDTQSLKRVLGDEGLSVTAILIRRVDGVPYYRYLSNGRHSDILELWSSSKFLGILNASESLRYESEGKLGLDSTVDGIPVGDLVTIVHNYDERNYTSNGLMSWFHDVGGREFANQILHGRWLNRPMNEKYGANYGAKSEAIGFEFKNSTDEVQIKPQLGWLPTNELSTLTLAEALKRVVMYRENPETHLEYSTWEDMKVLLYGAEESMWYDKQTPQGMESDTAVYMQNALDIHAMETASQGQWRIFSKLGLGFSRGGEFAHTDYACFPSFVDGEPQLDQGVELVISLHASANKDYVQGDLRVADIYRKIVQAVWNGEIR